MSKHNLITVSNRRIQKQDCQTVDARELHTFLGVGRDFSNWIKGRIEEYDFEENQDFVCSPIPASKGRGGQNRIDYALTLDMAKELSMVEKTARGKEARKYFIACERKLREKAVSPSLPGPGRKKKNEFIPPVREDDPVFSTMTYLLDHYQKMLKMERKYIKHLRERIKIQDKLLELC